ncbi:hypothetical protein CANINC_002862 [Pichia inconspicua]|uniref:WSC domain-containing protein n=1 Tax=Pichia inconspicua TaxID=52247 RepID=A0A4T0X1G3_9ASCO|nr:hypothetical protein CANINC_002862 [[Candida] inconspicua]
MNHSIYSSLRPHRPLFHLLAILLLLSPTVNADGQLLGCFSSVPDTFVLKSIYTWQSSKYCAGQCSGYDFFALTDGNACYCGSTFPLGGSDSNSCSQACVGFPSEQCGGADAFNILAQDGVDLAAAAASASANPDTTSGTTSSSTETGLQTTTNSTSSSSSSSSLSSSTTETTTTGNLVTTPSSTTSTHSPTTLTTHTTNQPSPVTSLLTTVLENSSATVTSIVYVTQSPVPSSLGSASPPDSNSKSSDNKGAIIGGVVGGILGLLIVAVTVLFLLRRRIFSGYYDSNGDDNMLADDVAYEEAMKAHSLENPFASEEDKEVDNVLLGRRRLSDGSLADATDYGMKVLRVANPDDDE